jgi:hypothetical protein
MVKRYSSVAAAVMLLASSSHVKADYIAIDLTPSSGFSNFCGAFGVGGSEQVGRGSGSATGNNYHALLWSGSAASIVDLNPPGFSYSQFAATNGSQHVGWGYSPTTGAADQALLWTGTATSAVNLNPSGFSNSYALGISGSQQVGHGFGSPTHSSDHALLWSGTAASVVDLNPTNFYSYSSVAYATNGSQQVGCFNTSSGGKTYAVLWSGTADSPVNLNPSGFTSSCAYGIGGSQQVGNGNGHALLWYGTVESVVDLNPNGFSSSLAEATNGFQQVGYASGPVTGYQFHALLWSGSPDSAVDLHQYLPGGFTNSRALGIDAQGNIVGRATAASGNSHAILWQVIPEPSTFALFSVAVLALAAWAWRRKRAV